MLAQREQIATLKALGFPTLPIVMHYLKLVMVIVTIGSIMGVGGGILLGHAMIASYHGFFRFPSLDFELDALVDPGGHAISLAAASLGSPDRPSRRRWRSAAGARRSFRQSLVEDLLPAWSILRHIAGRPFHTALTVVRPRVRRAHGRARPVLARCHRPDDGCPIQSDRTRQRRAHLS